MVATSVTTVALLSPIRVRDKARQTRNAVGMDEDYYDACDLENWYLAIRRRRRSGDHPFVPTAMKSSATTLPKQRERLDLVPTPPAIRSDSGWLASWDRLPPTAMISRHSPTSCLTRQPARSTSTSMTTPTASPIPSTPTLAIRPGPTSSGRLSKPLFAFMVIGLNWRIPLDSPATWPARRLPRVAPRHSVSELDPNLCIGRTPTVRHRYRRRSL